MRRRGDVLSPTETRPKLPRTGRRERWGRGPSGLAVPRWRPRSDSCCPHAPSRTLTGGSTLAHPEQTACPFPRGTRELGVPLEVRNGHRHRPEAGDSGGRLTVPVLQCHLGTPPAGPLPRVVYSMRFFTLTLKQNKAKRQSGFSCVFACFGALSLRQALLYCSVWP